MLHAHALACGVLSSILLAGCGSGSYSSTIGTAVSTGTTGTAPGGAMPITANFNGADPVTGTDDAVVATPSSSALSVAVGASRTLSIAFTSSDQRIVTGFGISASLGTLPAGWSGPQSFTCAAVSVGSRCVLNLEYAPAAVDSGTLTVDYVFIANSTEPATTGAVTVAYAATALDNVAATVTPTGQIVGAIGGGAQTVTVNFTTDDGNAATHLVSDLSVLPSGWTSASSSISCAIVSTGSGCSTVLTYTPVTAGSGTLVLNFDYADESGAAKSGTFSIPYAATSVGNVVATVSPVGQILAVQKTGGQPVAVTFTTDDGKPASKLSIASLTALPPGWTSASNSFSCATVATGNGCQLHLNYAPSALASGTLTLSYAYTDGSGVAQNGLLNIDYAATTNDNVIATVTPSGQVAALIGDGSRPGNGSQNVVIGFTTDDGRPATALSLTSSLGALPIGWSAAAPSFACSGIDLDEACQLSLIYAPTSPGNGTLTLNYAYLNNAGDSKTATVNVPYRATANDNIAATVSPSTLAVRTGSSNGVQVTFATDDGNPAGALTVTSGLGMLPAGWSGPSSFNCASVSAGTPCLLPLTYAPTIAASSSSLALGYSFINDAGLTVTGTVTLAYSATTPYLYVTDSATNMLSVCPLNVDDSVAACGTTGSGFSAPSAIALNGSQAYVADSLGNAITLCTFDAGGALSACAPTGGPFNAPASITFNAGGTLAYLGQSASLSVCTIAPSTGALTACAATGTAYQPLSGLALSADGHAYAVQGAGNPGTATLDVCTVAANGMLSNCLASGAAVAAPQAVLGIRNGQLYVSSLAALSVCRINPDASLGNCQVTGPAGMPGGIAFMDGNAYLSNGATVSACAVNGDGTLGGCLATTDPTFSGTAGLAVR